MKAKSYGMVSSQIYKNEDILWTGSKLYKLQIKPIYLKFTIFKVYEVILFMFP